MLAEYQNNKEKKTGLVISCLKLNKCFASRKRSGPVLQEHLTCYDIISPNLVKTHLILNPLANS